jgi:transposase
MPRHAIFINCEEKDRKKLEQLSSSRTSSKQLTERAKIILKCLSGMENAAVAEECNTRPGTVAKWRNRFAKDGFAGLEDAPRSGKPKIYPDLKERLLKTLESNPPKGQSSWDGKSLAMSLGTKPGIIWKLLREDGVQLQRVRSWCVSTDPEFAAKSADIIGLYLNPPERAIVLSVDEKPGIQALERKRGYVYTSSKKLVQGLQSTYKRNGTLNLFAALNVATGEVQKKTTQTKKREDFQTFMSDVIKDIPQTREIHVILDNYCTHKKNDQWLAEHPNVHFHFTPTSASWLNQVEIWFGILSRKALKNGSFESVEALDQAIEDFTNAYHQNAKPFVWRKREVKGSQLRNTISNLMN